MKVRFFSSLSVLTIALLAGTAFGQESFNIGPNSAGPVKTGMTVAEARKAMPGFEMKRTSDGEGLALISVERSGETHMVLFAGEDDPEARINDAAKIEYIEVLSSKYKTPQGLFPGMKISNAEKLAGKVTEIMLSEIESREYADFENGPKDYSFRLLSEKGMAGIYQGSSRTTKRYTPGAYIYTISVSSPLKDEGLSDANSSESGLESQDIAAHNKMIAEAASKNEVWTRSAEQVALKLAGEFSETMERTITIKAPGADELERLTITITDDGYLDDSVRGKREVMGMQRGTDGVWKLVSYSKGWRCWEGRGHDDYSAKPCN